MKHPRTSKFKMKRKMDATPPKKAIVNPTRRSDQRDCDGTRNTKNAPGG